MVCAYVQEGNQTGSKAQNRYTGTRIKNGGMKRVIDDTGCVPDKRSGENESTARDVRQKEEQKEQAVKASVSRVMIVHGCAALHQRQVWIISRLEQDSNKATKTKEVS